MNIVRDYSIASNAIYILLFSAPCFSSGLNINLDGDVVSSPCTVVDKTLSVKIDPVSKYYLYKNGNSAGTDFAIKLSDCDPSIASSAQISFTGIEASGFSGKLAVDSSSQAQGIALGLFNENDDFLKINNNATKLKLNNGPNEFSFKVKVFGVPVNIEKKDIQPGEFSATAVALITYS